MNSAYAYVGTKQITYRSSSGGAFMAIAKAFFDKYGVQGRVFGVKIFEQDVVYAVADNLVDCQAFQGSKYVWAHNDGFVNKVFEFLSLGKAVLFVGTPCMVASVRKMAENRGVKSDKLWLIDLICHGTVDEFIWKDYLKWLEKRHQAKVVDYSFRYKPIAWRGYPVYVKFDNGKELFDTYEVRAYIRAFLKRIIVRKSCFNCPFRNENRTGDITLGDFWGAEKTLLKEHVKNGCSLVLENTHCGSSIIRELRKNIEADGTLLEPVEKHICMQKQDNLKSVVNKPKEYELFWKTYNKFGFEQAMRKTGVFSVKGQIRAICILFIKKIGLYSLLVKIKNR